MTKKWWLQGIKYLLLISFIVPLLTACNMSDTVKDEYPLESVNGSGNETSYVYRAVGQTVPEVATQLIEKKKPDEQSEQSTERMFLVYSNEIIHVQQDTKIPEDTLVEVSSKEYVRQNYNMSFLQGYLLASLIGDLFDNGRYGNGGYRGYSSKDVYKPKQTYKAPTAQDVKKAPPMTVDRSGTIFKRSKNADSTAVGSNNTSTDTKKKSVITRDKSSTKSSSVFTKPRKSSAPKIRIGSGKIGRRR